MPMLNAAQILASKDLKHEDVDVPEWGGSVRVQELSAGDREWFQSQAITEQPLIVDGDQVLDDKGIPKTIRVTNFENLRSKLLARALVDEDGNRLFDDAEVNLLAKKNSGVVGRLFSVAQKLSGLGTDAVEEATKNSEAAPNSDLPSDSPVT